MPLPNVDARQLLETLLRRAGVNGVTAGTLSHPFSPDNLLDVNAYPRTLGAGAGILAGGALGAGLGLAGDEGVDEHGRKRRRGLFHSLLHAAGGAALGAGLGGAAGFALGDHSPTSRNDEIDNLKYERSGPARQALTAVSSAVPLLPGRQPLPDDYQKNVIEPVSAGDRTALAGKVTPQQTSVLAMSPHVPGASGPLRPQFVDNKPVNAISSDPLGLDSEGHTLTGSETLGSRVGYDYNGALDGFFGHRLALQPGASGVLVGSHAHGQQLNSTGGSSMSDILGSLKERGIVTPQTDTLSLKSCNGSGCDVPSMVQKTLGFTPRHLQYTPPGNGLDTETFEGLQKTLNGQPQLGRAALLRPRSTTYVSGEDRAFRQDTQPVIPTQLSRGAIGVASSVFRPAKQLERYLKPEETTVGPGAPQVVAGR